MQNVWRKTSDGVKMTDADLENIRFEWHLHVEQFNDKFMAEMQHAVPWSIAENQKLQ